ncbi:MAG: hypothetical protein R3F11_17685 [Verrucomicrobiales bacterium]
MAEQAKITSLDALEHFRSARSSVCHQVAPVLDEVSKVRRTRMWLESEQRLHWERGGELKRTKKLEQARRELYSAQLSSLQRVDVVKKMAVEWKRAVEKRRGSCGRSRGWHRKFDSRNDRAAGKRLEGFNT